MKIQDFRQVIGQWDSINELATKLHEKPFNVEKWRTRNRIPDRAFRRLVDVAKRDNKPITADLLVTLAEKFHRERRTAA